MKCIILYKNVVVPVMETLPGELFDEMSRLAKWSVEDISNLSVVSKCINILSSCVKFYCKVINPKKDFHRFTDLILSENYKNKFPFVTKLSIQTADFERENYPKLKKLEIIGYHYSLSRIKIPSNLFYLKLSCDHSVITNLEEIKSIPKVKINFVHGKDYSFLRGCKYIKTGYILSYSPFSLLDQTERVYAKVLTKDLINASINQPFKTLEVKKITCYPKNLKAQKLIYKGEVYYPPFKINL